MRKRNPIPGILACIMVLSLTACKKFEMDRQTLVRTEGFENVHYTGCLMKGNLMDMTGGDVYDHGFRWRKVGEEIFDHNVISLGPSTQRGPFEAELWNLDHSSTYEIWAYVGDGPEETWGAPVTITTLEGHLPEVNFDSWHIRSASEGDFCYEVLRGGHLPVESHGIYWARADNPTSVVGSISKTVGVDTEETGVFCWPVHGLETGVSYIVSPWARNAAGMVDLPQQNIFGGDPDHTYVVTLDPNPQLITATSAILGGVITQYGNSPITQRYLLLNDHEPVDDPDGLIQYTTEDVNMFEFEFSGLRPNTTYFYQAVVAREDGGVGGGMVKVFMTLPE